MSTTPQAGLFALRSAPERSKHVVVRERIVSYGEDIYDDRSKLRADVWEISGGVCEHPMKGTTLTRACGMPAMELAHIESIGAGGRRSADRVNNVLAACTRHARSTDDMSAMEWESVPPPHDQKALSEWIREERMKQGWAV